MSKSILTRTGKLKKRFLPAVYFDSSVLIDYWKTEGMELNESETDKTLIDNEPYLRVVRNILHSENRINNMVKIRKKLIFDIVKVVPVISPISLLELMEWKAEATFKQIASEASGTKFIQKKSKKEIGNYLKKILEMRRNEIKKQKEKKMESSQSTVLEKLLYSMLPERSFLNVHGLQGILQADIVNFRLTIDKVWKEPSVYGFLQLGVADIMHIMFAQHLGCKYIASFDSDFKRVKNIISEETGMEVLTRVEEIIDIL